MYDDMMNSENKPKSVFLIVLLTGFLLYASLYIYHTSFVIEGERFFSLFDDMMVSMRYADHLASGNGLVWNSGDNVEGFTNFLWVLLMAGFHLVPLSAAKTSLTIQITGALIMGVTLWMTWKLSWEIFRDSCVASGAVFLTAFYLPLITWSLQGTEVSLLTLIVMICLWLGHRRLSSGIRISPIYLILGLSTFIRPDMTATYIGFLLFFLIWEPDYRMRHIGTALSILIPSLLIQTGFRFWYFGDFLPNTYYLKLTGYPLGVRWIRGASVLFRYILNLNWILFLLPFGFAWIKREKTSLYILGVFAVQTVYSIYVGGDAWEWWGGSNRYISIAVPGFFIVFSAAAAYTSQRVIDCFRGSNEKGTYHAQHWLTGCVILAAFISFNSLNGPKSLLELSLLKKPLHVSENKAMVERGLLVKEISTPEAVIAVTWAGAIPYFSDRTTVDILGKCDRTIARKSARTAPFQPILKHFKPGHMKWNYAHSIGHLKPDIIVQLWKKFEEAEPFLKRSYQKVQIRDWTFFLRTGSPRIHWDRIQKMDGCRLVPFSFVTPLKKQE
jgi:hypothetical protein